MKKFHKLSRKILLFSGMVLLAISATTQVLPISSARADSTDSLIASTTPATLIAYNIPPDTWLFSSSVITNNVSAATITSTDTLSAVVSMPSDGTIVFCSWAVMSQANPTASISLLPGQTGFANIDSSNTVTVDLGVTGIDAASYQGVFLSCGDYPAGTSESAAASLAPTYESLASWNFAGTQTDNNETTSTAGGGDSATTDAQSGATATNSGNVSNSVATNKTAGAPSTGVGLTLENPLAIVAAALILAVAIMLLLRRKSPLRR